MTNFSDSQSKAETSARLASVTDNPRARELFQTLASEYAARAAEELAAERSPPLAPLSDSEQWLASLRAIRQQD